MGWGRLKSGTACLESGTQEIRKKKVSREAEKIDEAER
jgi:hypothetical protein